METTHLPWRRRHKRLFRVLLIVGLVLTYELGGACVPFWFHPTVNAQYQADWERADYYATGSTDRAALVADNSDALDLRLRMIGEAQERILFSTFEIRSDESGQDILAALLAAADRGVSVQFLCDGMNGLKNMTANPAFQALGTHPNVEIRWYNTPNVLAPWTFNGRLHDKYIVIDDQLLLLGGRNTFDYFLGDYAPAEMCSHDLDVLIYNPLGTQAQGSAVFQVEDYFFQVWDGPDCRTHLEGALPGTGGRTQAEAEALRARWEALTQAKPGLVQPDGVDYQTLTVPTEGVRLMSNPIHIFSKEPVVWWELMQLLEGAEESAWLQTPYAVLDAQMVGGLHTLAAAPADIRLQINSTAVGDNVMASSDYTLRRQEVIDTGITLYEYFGDRSSHGKSALVDDDLALVGSYNLDMRSTYIDTELMLAVHSEPFAAQLSQHLEEMAAQALPVNPDGSYQSRNGVEAKPLVPPRSWLYPITSVLVQPIRYLL